MNNKKRIVNYGLGKFIIKIGISELPTDIRDGIIESTKLNKYPITDDTKEIAMLIEHVVSIDNLS